MKTKWNKGKQNIRNWNKNKSDWTSSSLQIKPLHICRTFQINVFSDYQYL